MAEALSKNKFANWKKNAKLNIKHGNVDYACSFEYLKCVYDAVPRLTHLPFNEVHSKARRLWGDDVEERTTHRHLRMLVDMGIIAREGWRNHWLYSRTKEKPQWE